MVGCESKTLHQDGEINYYKISPSPVTITGQKHSPMV